MGPLQLGSLFRRSFSTIFSHGGLLIAVMLLFHLPAIALDLFTHGVDAEGQSGLFRNSGGSGWRLLGAMLGLFCSVLASACMTFGVLHLARGGSLSLGGVLDNGFRRVWRLLGLFFLLVLGVLVVMIPLAVLASLLGPLSILLVLGAAGVVFYLAVTYSLLIPILVAEDVPLLKSFARCRELINGHRGSILGGFVLVVLMELAVSVVFSVVFLLAGGSPFELEHPPISLTFASSLLGVVFSAFSSAFFGLAYHDLRANQEGASEDEISRMFE